MRKSTKEVIIGKGPKQIKIGSSNAIAIQSMCNTRTSDVASTVAQIKRLEKAGCNIIRVAVLNLEDAYAIKEIVKEINIPLVADIHFDYKLAIASIEAGVDKLRINPGNIGSIENVKKVVEKCKEYQIPICSFYYSSFLFSASAASFAATSIQKPTVQCFSRCSTGGIHI